jgi:hypothetical protein
MITILHKGSTEGNGITVTLNLQRLAMDTASFSGKLFLLEEDLLEAITNAYGKIDAVNIYSNELRDMALGPMKRAYLDQKLAVIDVAVDNLLEFLPQLIAVIDQILDKNAAGPTGSRGSSR